MKFLWILPILLLLGGCGDGNSTAPPVATGTPPNTESSSQQNGAITGPAEDQQQATQPVIIDIGSDLTPRQDVNQVTLHAMPLQTGEVAIVVESVEEYPYGCYVIKSTLEHQGATVTIYLDGIDKAGEICTTVILPATAKFSIALDDGSYELSLVDSSRDLWDSYTLQVSNGVPELVLEQAQFSSLSSN